MSNTSLPASFDTCDSHAQLSSPSCSHSATRPHSYLPLPNACLRQRAN